MRKAITYRLLFLALIFCLNLFFYFTLGLQDPRYHIDDLAHFLGGLGIALLAIEYFSGKLGHLSKASYLLTIVGITIFVGIAWEVTEYFAQQIPALHNVPIIGDLADTLTDLVNDTIGALSVTALHLLRRRQTVMTAEITSDSE